MANKSYKVIVRTADIEKAGTDCDIYIELSGPSGATGTIKLDKANRDDFERGAENDFYFNAADVSGVSNCKLIWLRTDEEAPAWCPEWVQVYEMAGSGQYNFVRRFDFNVWLGQGGRSRDEATR